MGAAEYCDARAPPPRRRSCPHGRQWLPACLSRAVQLGGEEDGVTISMAVDLKMNFSILQKCLNSDVICLFCVEVNTAPKIMKIFV